jgi:hypothetical protein
MKWKNWVQLRKDNKMKKIVEEVSGEGMTETKEIKETKLIEVPKTLKIHVAENKMTWQDAMDYAESIGMRLPSLIELQTIAASTDDYDYLGWIWSASTRSSNTTDAWYVYLDNGDTYYNNKTFSLSVLCVSP